MDGWVRDRGAPPANQYPKLSDGTLVRREAVAFPPIPGVQSPQMIQPARQALLPCRSSCPRLTMTATNEPASGLSSRLHQSQCDGRLFRRPGLAPATTNCSTRCWTIPRMTMNPRTTSSKTGSTKTNWTNATSSTNSTSLTSLTMWTDSTKTMKTPRCCSKTAVSWRSWWAPLDCRYIQTAVRAPSGLRHPREGAGIHAGLCRWCA
jgi:hypothetical protein